MKQGPPKCVFPQYSRKQFSRVTGELRMDFWEEIKEWEI